MIYAWRYPKSIHRSVMIGVNPPGHFLWDPKTTDEQIGRYAALCAQDAELPRADRRPRRVDAGARRRTSPITGCSCRSRRATCRLASLLRPDGRDVATPAPISAPMTIDSLALGRERRRERALVHVAAGRSSSSRRRSSGATLAAVGAQPTPTPRSATSRRRRPRLDPRRPRHRLPLGRRPAGRRVAGEPRRRTSTAACGRRTCETLLIGGTLDVATPPQNATRELLPHLPNGHQVVLPELRAHDDFWSVRSRRPSTHLVNTFLDSGRVDDSRYTPQHDRLHARRHARRRSPRIVARRDGGPRARSRSLSLLLMCAPGRTRAAASGARRARRCARCLPARARARRLVRRRADRRSRRCRPCRSTTSCSPCLSIGAADRPRHLLGLGRPRPAGQRRRRRARGGARRARSSARGSGSTRRPGCSRWSPRSSGAAAGGEPRAARARHRLGSVGARPGRRTDGAAGVRGCRGVGQIRTPRGPVPSGPRGADCDGRRGRLALPTMTDDNGIGLFLTALPAALAIDSRRRAEAAGFRSGWFPEITFGDSFGPATAAALQTTRVGDRHRASSASGRGRR